MRTIIPTKSHPDVLRLTSENTPAILAALKAQLKNNSKKNLDSKVHQNLIKFIDEMRNFINALDAPYPSSLASAAFSYAWDSARHTKRGADTINKIITETIPNLTLMIEALSTEEKEVHETLILVLKYFLALKLVEETRQAAVESGQAGMLDQKAYDVLQQQEPKMSFRGVCNLVITPMIDTIRKKLSVVEERQLTFS